MRGIFGSIAHQPATPAVVRAAAGAPSYGLIPPLGSVPSVSGMLISQATALTVSALYACVRRIAADVSRCPATLYRENADGSRVTVTDHPVAELLSRPNRVQPWFNFCEQSMIGYLLRGNAYAAIRRDARGDPIELVPVNPDAVLVLETVNCEVFYNTNRIGLWQIGMLRDFPVAIPAEDMLHLKGLTFNSLVGVSIIGLARDTIGLAMAQEQQAARWVGNAARPSGVLKSPKPLTEPAAQRLKKSWQDYTGGIQNVGSTAVLEDGVEWQQLSLTSVDLEFLNQRNFEVLEVCRWFDMPPHKVGIVDRAATQNIPQQDQDYVNSCVMKHATRIERCVEFTFDLDREGLRCDIDQTALLRADVMTRYNAHRTGITSGFLKPNEARRAENLPPDPEGDVLLVPSNTAALGSDMSGQASDGAGRPPGGQSPKASLSTGGDQPGSSDVSK